MANRRWNLTSVLRSYDDILRHPRGKAVAANEGLVQRFANLRKGEFVCQPLDATCSRRFVRVIIVPDCARGKIN